CPTQLLPMHTKCMCVCVTAKSIHAYSILLHAHTVWQWLIARADTSEDEVYLPWNMLWTRRAWTCNVSRTSQHSNCITWTFQQQTRSALTEPCGGTKYIPLGVD